ncbi:PREDICTED: protein cutoff [Drosophila arizonae]|uniref:Decapping nuclease n=1 Tax=Drosophila arizonae TaxID=7263 RepID=A0ABM1PBG2_DROAR|nr:PREDICTED: protein cutoff [Drosophila arizonae]
MCAPYEYKNNWTLAVSKYRNTIYMCPVQNTEQPLSVDVAQQKDLLMTKWMRALKKRCLTAGVGPIGSSDRPREIKLKGQYYCIFSTDICGIHVLFDAPIIAEHSINTICGLPKTFVDLKLRLDKMKPWEWSDHNRNEVLKWWAESFLAGIEKIYIAYHDKQGNVHKIIHRKLRELWRECEHDWSPNICGHFLRRCLDNIKTILADVDNASTVYLLEYDAENGNIKYKYAEERSEHTFIPDWFRLMMEESLEHLNAATQFSV